MSKMRAHVAADARVRSGALYLQGPRRVFRGLGSGFQCLEFKQPRSGSSATPSCQFPAPGAKKNPETQIYFVVLYFVVLFKLFIRARFRQFLWYFSHAYVKYITICSVDRCPKKSRVSGFFSSKSTQKINSRSTVDVPKFPQNFRIRMVASQKSFRNFGKF